MRWASPPESVGVSPAQRQIVQSHVVEERQAIADSRRTRSPAICFSSSTNFRSRKNSSALPSGQRPT